MNSSDANKKHSALNDAAELEFPDWGGMTTHQVRMSPAEAFRWNEEMLTLFPPKKCSAKLEAARRCHIEFIL